MRASERWVFPPDSALVSGLVDQAVHRISSSTAMRAEDGQPLVNP
ncbi:hypothetical protein HEB94_002342 [Actinopolymorpha pittospori]|uniref:Uncharacterized protein n=1 Tax=Actinopolymorpha pittospori TaxID=648752 RepID=A0A927R8K6_9ACTN|nr:hypothetical protein [Actinopolymorpha pittospori]